MNRQRFSTITGCYAKLRIAVVGDFCLDRYLEIDPARQETSLENGHAVHNVINVRAQAGGAGTILNNLVALGIGEIFPVGFCGDDGEGYELQCALSRQKGVNMRFFFKTPLRRTFTYCKPLLMHQGRPPEELERLDSKNWSPTPDSVLSPMVKALEELSTQVQAIVLLEQVDLPETGVLCRLVRHAAGQLAARHAHLPILADSRQGLRHFPPMIYKMNAREFGRLMGTTETPAPNTVVQMLGEFARKLRYPVFVTLAEHGLAGALPDGSIEYIPALPVRGPIDIVGAGDAVSANLVSALAAGASLREALEIANAAASVVIHKLGTTGTATPAEIAECLGI